MEVERPRIGTPPYSPSCQSRINKAFRSSLELLRKSLRGFTQLSEIQAQPGFPRILLRKCACLPGPQRVRAGNRLAAFYATSLFSWIVLLVLFISVCTGTEPAHRFITSLAAREPESSRELEIFPDLLLTEEDPAPVLENRGKGSFVRVEGDWILCRGPNGKGEGPAGPNFHVDLDGKSYDSIARFNNEAVNLALRSTTDPGALDRAESMFRAGFANDPQFFPFNYNLSRLLRIRRLYDESLRFAERSAAMMPRDYRLDLILGSLYEFNRQDIAAREHYLGASRKNSYSSEALIKLAGFYRRTDRESLAEDLLRRGMKRFETDPTLRLGLGELRMRQGLLNDARVLFESIDRPVGERSMLTLRLHHRMAQLYDLIGDYRRSRDAYRWLLSDTSHPYFVDLSIAGLRREKDRVERLANYE